MSRSSRKTESANSRLPFIIGGLALVVLAIALSWWSTRAPVELSEHGYDVTLALYRVCNQRSVDGLQRVEAELASKSDDSQTGSAGDLAIRAIIEQAKAGDWAAATAACRQLMDDQVRRQ